MPVSRKRKKKSQSGRRAPRTLSPSAPAAAGVLSNVLEYRQKLTEHRVGLAGDVAGALIDALIASPGGSDDDLEDDLCVRYGAAMVHFEDREGAIEDFVNPTDLVGALLSALDRRWHEAAEAGADVGVLQRVLAVVAGVLPHPLDESAGELVSAHLDASAARRVARGRALTGPVLWTHDVYGGRWAVVAPFASVAGPDRWYLWDVDTCAHEALTVFSGFHTSAESALAAWRESVGQTATDGVSLSPVDDAETLVNLLPGDADALRTGGEDEQQYAEFLRCRRLGQTVREAARRVRGRASIRLTAADAQAQFAQRLRQIGYHAGSVGDEDADPDELATEVAESWSPRGCPTLYPFCSPHKVAVTVLSVRDYYKEDFAAELVALLPEWIRFLAEHTAMPAELTERCLAYASGELRYPGILDDQGRLNPMAPVPE